jgi:hypothetical protein
MEACRGFPKPLASAHSPVEPVGDVTRIHDSRRVR